jgi:hypothetical protein
MRKKELYNQIISVNNIDAQQIENLIIECLGAKCIRKITNRTNYTHFKLFITDNDAELLENEALKIGVYL